MPADVFRGTSATIHWPEAEYWLRARYCSVLVVFSKCRAGYSTAGHGIEDRQGAVALFDGDAELNALHQPLEALGVVALFGADHPFGDDPAAVGEGQHDAAVEPLNAQVDLIVRREGIGNDLKRVVNDASPPD